MIIIKMKAGSIMKGFHGLSVLGMLGLSIGLPLIGAIYIGRFLDERYGTHPLILSACIILAIISGYRSAYQLLIVRKNKRGK